MNRFTPFEVIRSRVCAFYLYEFESQMRLELTTRYMCRGYLFFIILFLYFDHNKHKKSVCGIFLKPIGICAWIGICARRCFGCSMPILKSCTRQTHTHTFTPRGSRKSRKTIRTTGYIRRCGIFYMCVCVCFSDAIWQADTIYGFNI